MLSIKKILLPVDFPNTSLRIIHQAATLAHHFHSEIVIFHAVTAESHAAGVPVDGAAFSRWDMLAEITREAEKKLEGSLQPELEGLAIRCVLLRGNPAQAIVQTARVEEANMIMMASGGAAFNQFLLGSVTAKILHGSECSFSPPALARFAPTEYLYLLDTNSMPIGGSAGNLPFFAGCLE